MSLSARRVRLGIGQTKTEWRKVDKISVISRA
jgi:hypothetical protein